MIGTAGALIVFAKVPTPGTVKTRLTTLLSEIDAARLYEAFLRDALDAYGTLGVAVRLYLGPSPDDLPTGLVPDGVTLHQQRGEGLGQRMLHAFVETFVAGHERAVVIGTDHPTLPLAFVEQAFEELSAPLATVIGPSDDGGYYLLGMNEVYSGLFEGMDYSHPEVFADTLQRAHATNASISILPTWYDVDTPDALTRLADDLERAPGGAPRTREVVAMLQQKYGLRT